MSDDTPGRYTLAELEESSGVPERTIRFYIGEGLVSPAIGRGRARYFTSDHLRELAYVAAQRERRLSIDEIREQLARERQPEAPSGETWERFTLHPDLELSIRSGAPRNVRALAAELQAVARDWFGDDAEDDPDTIVQLPH